MVLANYSRTTLEDLMSDKIFVIDTSVFLADSECINSYEDNDIIIPLKVLEEIDRHKGRQDGPGLNARSIIRKLDQLLLTRVRYMLEVLTPPSYRKIFPFPTQIIK